MNWVVFALLGLYFIYGAAMVFMHPTFIYPFGADRFDAPGWSVNQVGPSDVTIAHMDGPDDIAVVFFMGNGGSLAYFTNPLAAHSDAGRTVAALAYRGGGGVAGTPSERQLKEDALATFDWLDARHNGPIVVHGYSMGTGLALHVAVNRQVSGVILDAPFMRMCELMARASYLPACYMPGIQKWNSAALVSGLDAPVIVQHGTADQLIPVDHGVRLVARMEAAGLDVTFHPIEGATHNNLTGQDGYRVRIDAFVNGL